MKYIYATLVWLSIVSIAILNGGLRENVLDKYLGCMSNPLSGVILSLCILLVAMWLVPKIKGCKGRDYLFFGVMWVVLTNLFDLTMILKGGGSVSDLVSMYDITTGNLWFVVVLTTFVAPILAGRKKEKSMRNCILLIAVLLFASCGNDDKKNTSKSSKTKARPTYYERSLNSMVRIITYDVYGQKIADGQGVYVGADIVITSLGWFKGAYTAKINTMESKAAHPVYGYVAYDLDNNLVALRIGKRNKEKLMPIDTTKLASTDTIYTLDCKKKKTLKTSFRYSDGMLSISELKEGAAVIDNKGCLRGLATDGNKIVSADKLVTLMTKLVETHYNIYELRLKSNKTYPSYTRIAGFKIKTTMGDIKIRLFNETKEYRDNFIKLVCEDFYDSLMVHRVLPNYLIQTGAADTRYAKADDVVGWQGPGYTLPMDIHKHLFHKRGMVAASKLPEDHNKSNRCDGSQFFIVVGRKFSEVDLRGIEKEYGKRFTSEQISAYTTIGGAPYLDGDYTVFAEVTEGMSVVDKIASVALNGDRPKIDIRIKDIEIIWR